MRRIVAENERVYGRLALHLDDLKTFVQIATSETKGELEINDYALENTADIDEL